MRIDSRERPGVARERFAAEPQRRAQRHSVHVAARARLRRVDVGVRIDPEHAARPGSRCKTPKRAERDRVIASEDERRRAGTDGFDDLRRDPLARALDLGKEARAFVLERRRLRHRRLDVAVVAHLEAEARQPLLEPRVAHRRRAHVDPAAALPEVESRADDRDLALRVHAGNLQPDAATLRAEAR